jgi:hypothetical protein
VAAPTTPDARAAALPAPPGPAGAAPGGDVAALRAAHDALAERISTRLSVDRMKEGGLMTFFTVISFGMTCKLGWDRWGWLPANKPKPEGEYPLWFLLMALVTLVLLRFAVRHFQAAAVLRREEDALFQQVRALRAQLGLDT